MCLSKIISLYYYAVQGPPRTLGEVMYRLAVALLFVIAAAFSARAQGLPNVTLGPLPVPSYWVSDRGSQLKLYAFDAKPVPGTQGHGYFKGVLSSAAAPPGCQYQTFEVQGGEYFIPQIAFAVTWKNLVRDCGAQTAWVGVLNGRTLQLEWSLSKRKANGGLVPTKHGGIESFKQMP